MISTANPATRWGFVLPGEIEPIGDVIGQVLLVA